MCIACIPHLTLFIWILYGKFPWNYLSIEPLGISVTIVFPSVLTLVTRQIPFGVIFTIMDIFTHYPCVFYFIPFPIPVHNRAFFHSTQHILHESRASFKINNSSLFCFDLDCSYCLLRIGHIVHIIFRVSWIIYIGTFLKVCCMYMLHSRFNIKSFSYEVKCHAHLKNHNSWYVMILYSINHVEWLS